MFNVNMNFTSSQFPRVERNISLDIYKTPYLKSKRQNIGKNDSSSKTKSIETDLHRGIARIEEINKLQGKRKNHSSKNSQTFFDNIFLKIVDNAKTQWSDCLIDLLKSKLSFSHDQLLEQYDLCRRLQYNISFEKKGNNYRDPETVFSKLNKENSIDVKKSGMRL